MCIAIGVRTRENTTPRKYHSFYIFSFPCKNCKLRNEFVYFLPSTNTNTTSLICKRSSAVTLQPYTCAFCPRTLHLWSNSCFKSDIEFGLMGDQLRVFILLTFVIGNFIFLLNYLFCFCSQIHGCLRTRRSTPRTH